MYNKKDFLAELKFTYINSEVKKYEKQIELAQAYNFTEVFINSNEEIKRLKSDPDYKYYESLNEDSRKNLKHLDLEYNDFIGPDKLITVAAFLYPDVNDYIYKHGENETFSIKEGLEETYLSDNQIYEMEEEIYYDPECSLILTDFVFQKKLELLLNPADIATSGYWSSWAPDFFYKKFLKLEADFEKGSNALGVDYKEVFPELAAQFNKLKVTLEAYIESQQVRHHHQPEKAFELFPEAFSYYEFKHPQELLKQVRQAFVNDMRSEDFVKFSENPKLFDRVSDLRFESHKNDIELNQEPDPVQEPGDSGLF